MMASPKNGVSEIERKSNYFYKGGRFVLLSEPNRTLIHTRFGVPVTRALDIKG